MDGLYSNNVRLLKEYSEKILKNELKQEKINDVGLKSVLQLLADKDLRGAETLLNQMVSNYIYTTRLNCLYKNLSQNFDPNQKIYQICFFTPYKQLRDYLISVLIDRKKLNDAELDMINYLKLLESVYTCHSFEQAKKSFKTFGYFINLAFEKK